MGADAGEPQTRGARPGARESSASATDDVQLDAVSEPDDDGAPPDLVDVEHASASDRVAARAFEGVPSLSPGMVFLNVALSQGVFGLVLVVSAVAAEIPRGALGVDAGALSWELAVLGIGFGGALYVADEVGAWVAGSFGLDHTEGLRELLAPESPGGWVILLGGVLPIVAGFEELLFRGILVGAVASGFGVSPWVLVVASSILFGLGHGAQGRLGVLVTAALGVVLGVAFVLTESLLVVVSAHYVVNALEFVVHEGLGVDWRE